MSKKILGIIASIALVLSVGFATVASAFTASDIAVLKAIFGASLNASQIAALDALASPASGSVTTTTSGSATSDFTFTRDLDLGKSGADVTALQNFLISGGYMASGYPFGYFGSVTKAAVIKFQLAKGITPPAGYFGAKSRAFVNGSYTTTTTTTTTGTTVAAGTGLNFSLAASSPASGTIVQGQAAADLAEFTFVNTSGAPAVVTNVSLQRGGVSADTSLVNVYLFQGAVRLTDAATVSAGKITFNSGVGLFTVAPGQSVTIAVKADISALASAGQTINVILTSVLASVPGTGVTPITGSTQQIASAPDLATVGLTLVQPSLSVDAGALQYTIWGANLTQGGRAVYLKSMAVKVIGSVPTNSLANIGLFVSGVQVAMAAGVDANGMITFDLATPYKIDSARSVEVRADVVNGANRSFSVQLQNAADFQVVDSNYNVGISASGIPVTTGTIQINVGSLSASADSSLSSGNVVLGSTGVSLAKYTLRGYGEDVKVSSLYVAANTDLTNVTLYVDGSSISSSQNVASTTYAANKTLFNLGSSLIIPAGKTVSLEIKGDLKNANGVNTVTGSQVIVTLMSATNNAQGSYSSSLTTFPSSSIVGPTLTVVGAGLTLAPNAAYNNTTLTANSTNFKIGSYVMSAASAEPIRVTGLTVGIGGTLGLTALSNLYTVVNGVSSTKVNPQLSNNIAANFTIPANTAQIVDVYADVGALSSTPVTTYGTGVITMVAAANATTTISTASTSPIKVYGDGTAAYLATATINAINSNPALYGVTASASTSNTALVILTNIGGPVSATTSIPSYLSTSTVTTTANTSNVASSATASTSLAVTAAGVTSNINASKAAVNGQTLTVGVGQLVGPTLTTDSPSAQLVIGGTNNSTIGYFNFKATVGAATITELDFAPISSGLITSITAGGVTSPVATNATTTIAVNIPVGLGNTGTTVPVTVNYGTISSTNGISDLNLPSVTLTVSKVVYVSGNATQTAYPVVPTNALTPVAAYPLISIVSNSSTVASLNGTSVLLGQVSVTAIGNTISLNTLPVILSERSTATTSSAILTLADSANTNITLATTSAVSAYANSLIFHGGYQITAGKTKIFNVYATVTGADAQNGDAITMKLGARADVSWDDVEGGAVSATAELIPSYNLSTSATISQL